LIRSPVPSATAQAGAGVYRGSSSDPQDSESSWFCGMFLSGNQITIRRMECKTNLEELQEVISGYRNKLSVPLLFGCE